MAKSDSREKILQAARELFAECGFHATATAEIAQRAGVAEGLIFHYYKTKSGLLLVIFDEMFEELNAAAETAVDGARTGMQAIQDFARSHFRYLKNHHTCMRISLRDLPVIHGELEAEVHKIVKRRAGQRLQMLTECLKRGIKDGTVRKVPVRKTAAILGGSLLGVTHLLLRSPLEIPSMDKELVAFWVRSLEP